MLDAVKYEGNIARRWGILSAEEMVHRFWIGTIDGTYVGHGETYNHPESIWWAHGGVLRGQSPSRIDFLRKIVESGPASGLNPIDKWQESRMAGSPSENYFLVYLGREPATHWTVAIPAKERDEKLALPNLKVEVIDCLNKTIKTVEESLPMKLTSPYYWTCPTHPELKLPGLPMTAIRLTEVK